MYEHATFNPHKLQSFVGCVGLCRLRGVAEEIKMLNKNHSDKSLQRIRKQMKQMSLGFYVQWIRFIYNGSQ